VDPEEAAALDRDEARALVGAMRAEGEVALAEAGVARGDASFALAVDGRYRGRQKEVTAELAPEVLGRG
jgi:hypothetical protein